MGTPRQATLLFAVSIALALVGLLLLLLSGAYSALAAWLVIMLIILDTGAGVPLIFQLISWRAFKPSNHYQRLKSKYLLRG